MARCGAAERPAAASPKAVSRQELSELLGLAASGRLLFTGPAGAPRALLGGGERCISTEDNKLVVRRFFEAIGDLERQLDLLTDDYSDHRFPPGWPPGKAGFRQLATRHTAAFPDIEVILEDLLAEGDRVVVRLALRGTHRGELMGIPPTGKQVTFSSIGIYRIAGGKIAETWQVTNDLGLVQQLGAVLTPGAAATA